MPICCGVFGFPFRILHFPYTQSASYLNLSKQRLSRCLTFLLTSSTTKTSSTLPLPDPGQHLKPSPPGRSGLHPNSLPRSHLLPRRLRDQSLVRRSTRSETL